MLQAQDAPARVQARDQFRLVHGLDEVIVGARLQARDDVFLGVAGGQQQRIHIAIQLQIAHRLAQRHPVHFRHFPVSDQHGVVALGHPVERLGTVGHGIDLIPRLLQKAGHEHPRDWIVLRQQYGRRWFDCDRSHRIQLWHVLEPHPVQQ
jgi:hypothetical protein